MEEQMVNDQRALAIGCPVCGSARASVFAEMNQVPVHCNVLWPTREGALAAPRGDVQLAFCKECGHVFNTAFDPSLMEYTQLYENSLHFSSTAAGSHMSTRVPPSGRLAISTVP